MRKSRRGTNLKNICGYNKCQRNLVDTVCAQEKGQVMSVEMMTLCREELLYEYLNSGKICNSS